MTDPAKPLHVRVAEVLGWTNLTLRGYIFDHGGWQEDRRHWHGRDPERLDERTVDVPWYDRVWEDGGPLIEKYGITLVNAGGGWSAAYKYDVYGVYGEVESHEGTTPLEVVCNLLLAMHAAGKLEAK